MAEQGSTAPTAAEEIAAIPGEAAAPEETAQVMQTLETPDSTLSLWLTQPGPGGVSCGGWAGLGLLAGLLAAGSCAAIAAWRRKEKAAREERARKAPRSVTVEKLHEQGARPGQQDCFFVSTEEETSGLLAVVADGMGGLADGDKVSLAAVTAMASGFFAAQGEPGLVLLSLLKQAAGAVNELLGEDGLYHSGSTLAAGLLRDGAFHYLSVGDSRISLYRDGVLYQLNREHVYRNELYVRAVNGEGSLQDAAAHPKGGGLTSFLGMGELKYVDLPARPVAVRPGDRFLLMSDGVYNALSDAELTAALDSGPGLSAQAIGKAIKAKAYPNQDNYTAVVINC